MNDDQLRDKRRLEKAIIKTEFFIFGLWSLSLLLQLIAFLRNHYENSWKDYVIAGGTGLTFLCYCVLIFLRSKCDNLVQQENEKLNAKIDKLSTKIEELETALTGIQKTTANSVG